MFRPSYPIVTDRLLLRPYTDGDFDALYAFQSREDVARYLEHDARDRGETREALGRRIETQTLEKEGDALVLAVTLRGGGELIGEVLLSWLSEPNRQGEIGFIFHPGHQGKGYAKEASLEVLRLGFEELGLHRIIGQCDPRNGASWGLMERLGMRREAHLREFERFKGEWGDLFVYAMLAAEWKERRRPA